ANPATNNNSGVRFVGTTTFDPVALRSERLTEGCMPMSVPVSRFFLARATGLMESALARVRSGARPGEPNELLVLVGASLAGLAVISLWRFQHRLGPRFVALFAKEGPLEHLTWILALTGSLLAALATWRFSRPGFPSAPPRLVR